MTVIFAARGLAAQRLVVDSRPDRRSTFAMGAIWSTRIISLAMELVLPVLAGWWADDRWGTAPWWTLAGVAVGIAVSGWHFFEVVRSLGGSQSPPRSRVRD